MQAVILTGGLGTRLGGLTVEQPKALIPVLGEPFIGRQLALLQAQGVTEVVLCIGHLGEQIRACCGTGEAFGLAIRYSEDGERLLGTGGALKRAESLLAESFFLIWGDSYVLIDYRDLARSFRACGLPAMMVVYRNAGRGERSNVLLTGNRVACYDKWQPGPEMEYVDNGVTLLSRALLQRVPAGEPYAIERLYQQLAAEGALGAYETGQRFYEIGSHTGIREFEDFLRGQGIEQGEV